VADGRGAAVNGWSIRRDRAVGQDGMLRRDVQADAVGIESLDHQHERGGRWRVTVARADSLDARFTIQDAAFAAARNACPGAVGNAVDIRGATEVDVARAVVAADLARGAVRISAASLGGGR
jgi:hypothetical protein